MKRKANPFLGERLHKIRVDLLNFWGDFGGKANYGKGYSKQAKLDALKKMSNKFYFKRTTTMRKYRRKFNKFYKSMFNFPCFVCEAPSEHRHHIIMLKNGGLNSKLNRVSLCAYCHSLIHSWIKRPAHTGQWEYEPNLVQTHSDASSI